MQIYEEICQKIGQSGRHKTRSRGFLSTAAQPCNRTFISATLVLFFLEFLALKINTAEVIPDQKQALQESKQFKFTKFCLNESPDSQQF
jgi:hypothetical protein